MPDRPPVDDPRFWDAAWVAGDDEWDAGEAPPPIASALAALPVGRDAVVLGCGRGHEARALARLRWPHVVGLDFSPVALDEARAVEAADAPWEGRPPVEWRLQDLFTLGDTDPASFDLAVEHASFIAIDPRRRAGWARAVARALRPGGSLLALVSLKPRTGGPPFEVRREELEAILPAAGFALERVLVPENSFPVRQGRELLVLATLK